jgi:hypothetical protein
VRSRNDDCSPFKRSAQFQFVYVTLECKCWLAHELRFSTVANRHFYDCCDCLRDLEATERDAAYAAEYERAGAYYDSGCWARFARWQELRHRSRTPEEEAELRQIEVERVLDRVGKS